MKNLSILILFIIGFKLKAQVITTIAGNGECCNPVDGVSATASSIYRPINSVFDAMGNMYIAEENCIRKIDASTGIITMCAGTGSGGYTGDGGPAINAELERPTGLAFDSYGNLFITDNSKFTVRKVSNVANDIVAYNTNIQIYPNPASSVIQIRNSEPGERYNIQISNVSGQVFLKQTLNHSALDISALPERIYFVQVEGNKGSGMYKLVISR